MRFNKAMASALLFTLLGSMTGSLAQAQHMQLLTPRGFGSLNDPITFDIIADGNIGGAVNWGTTVALSDPLHMTFVPNLDGQGDPYRTIEKFFDTDYSDVSQLGNGLLSLNFFNNTPGANFNYNGLTYLAEFQVLLGTGTPFNTDLTVGLAPLGIPPYGTAMQDDATNNILLPTDPAHPNDNVATAHLYTTGSGPNLRWQIGFPPQDVPEPSAWLTGLAGLSVGIGLLRRRRI